EFGNRRAVEEIVGEHYTHFIDLRRGLDPARPRFELRPGATLGAYAEEFGEPGSRNFTDILVLSLEPAVAAGLDVCASLEPAGTRLREPDSEPAESGAHPDRSGRIAALRSAKRELLAKPPSSLADSSERPADRIELLRRLKRSPEAAALRKEKHALLDEHPSRPERPPESA